MTTTLPLSRLNELRREAVRRRLAGETLRQIAEATGLSAPTVIAANRAFETGGWAAVSVAERGRSVGEGRRLAVEQEARLIELIAAGPPEAQGIDSHLWQLPAVLQLAEEQAGVSLSARTVATYLERWGLTAPRPAQRLKTAGESLRQWEETVYPGLKARARAEGAAIYWIDELPLRDSGGRNVVRAVSNRGRLLWLAYDGTLRAPVLIDFIDRLLGCAGQKVYVILDGMRWQRAAALGSWLHERQDALLMFQTPPPDSSGALRVQATDPRRSLSRQPQSPAEGTSLFSLELKLLAARSSSPAAAYTGRTTTRKGEAGMSLTHLQRLEAESIQILREVVAEAENPVMLYSIGKDSSVMLHLAMKAFYPGRPPFPLLHVDTTWKFREMYEFRDVTAKKLGLDLLVHINPDGLAKNINPFTHGSAIHTDIMKTEGLKQALDKYGFDAAFGGARRDEEKSRAKERIFSFRSSQHRWDPKSQRPELWHVYNARKHKGESIRIFPLSNWTELDIWQYIYLQNIPIVPLYYAKERPVVMRDGSLIMVDDDRMPLHDGEVPMWRKVRFRTLGCYPLTGAIESEADTLPKIIQEMLLCKSSERQGRVIDRDSAGSMEKKKQEGYF